MKKIIILFLFLITMNGLYSFGEIFANYNTEVFGEEICEDIVNEYLKNNIPESLIDTFLKYTTHENDVVFSILCLSVAEVESACWKYFKSKPNLNGSIDYGPMGLNSYNIKNKKFMQIFAPKEELPTQNEFYMAICINLLKDHYDNLGVVNALYVYNGGYSAINRTHTYNKTRKHRMTRRYSKLVLSRYNNHIKKLNEKFNLEYSPRIKEKEKRVAFILNTKPCPLMKSIIFDIFGFNLCKNFLKPIKKINLNSLFFQKEKIKIVLIDKSHFLTKTNISIALKSMPETKKHYVSVDEIFNVCLVLNKITA